MATTYGIISDIHTSPIGNVAYAINKLKEAEADSLILNGNLCGQFQTLNETADFFAQVLMFAGESGLESYVLPGSHEIAPVFSQVMDAVSARYSNLHNTLDKSYEKIKLPDHHLIFLPGSDAPVGPAIQYGYKLEPKSALDITLETQKNLTLVHMNKLRYLTTAPEQTVVVSPVPRLFNTPLAPDFSDYGLVTEDFTVNKARIINGTMLSFSLAQDWASKNYPVELRHENRGNCDLTRLFTELQIAFGISGQVPESAGSAVNANGTTVAEDLYVLSLFWNASCLDKHLVGLLTVANDTGDNGVFKALYENVWLNK